jgi:hypothetical protein
MVNKMVKIYKEISSLEDDLLENMSSFIKSEDIIDLTYRIKKGDIIVEGEEAYEYCSLTLPKAFPFEGSSMIKWDKVPGSIYRYETEQCSDDIVSESVCFAKKMFRKQKRSQRVMYFNDSGANCVLMIPIYVLKKCIHILLECSEHHYFVAHDFSWCMEFRRLEHMAFGYRPPKK